MHERFTLIKFSDEGTSSPFPARLMLQMCELRDGIILDSDMRKRFDEAYGPIIDNFMETRQAISELKQLEERHRDELRNGSAAKIAANGHITITRPIEVQYRGLIKEFFLKGQMIISTIPRVGKVFGLKTSFFFADDAKYSKGAKHLEQKWPNAILAIKHLDWARSGWYSDFNSFRNRIVHESFKFPNTTYEVDADSKVTPKFPALSDVADNCKLFEKLCECILELVEACVIFFFSTQLRGDQVIMQIPEDQRDPANVRKYRLCMRLGDRVVPIGH